MTLKVDEATKISDVLQKFRESSTDLLLIDTNTVVTEPHLELLTDYPRSITTALVAPQFEGDTRVAFDLVQSASSAYHSIVKGGHNFLGIIRLSQNQRESIVQVLSDISITNKPGHAIDLILVGLVRSAIHVGAAQVAGAPYIRSSDSSMRNKTVQEIASLNQARLRLKLANRANDGFFSVFFLRKFSKLFTWAAIKLKLSPNQVTITSFLIGLLSAYEFSKGEFWTTFAGAVLLQLSIIVDCVDGELARYTRKFSSFGAWLDAITDRIKEYLVYFALASGAEKNGKDVWVLAIGMMLFQTFRHLSDYNFARIKRTRFTVLPILPFDQVSDEYVPLKRDKKSRLRYWAGKVIQFPIGERWLVISVTSVLGGPIFTFIAMPILSLMSIAVVFRGRILETLRWPKNRVNKALIDHQLDFFTNSKSTNRFDWLEPSILRFIEGGLIILGLHLFNLDSSSTFLILFAILFGHYDSLYRALAGEQKPKWLSRLGLFIPGRLVLIAVFIALDLSLQPLVYYFGLLYFVVSSLQWIAANFKKGK